MLGIVLSLSAALGFGASAVFARLGMEHMRSTTATTVSLATSTTVTLAIALALHSSEIPRVGGVSYLWLLLVGVLTFPVGRLFNYTAVRLAGVSRASPVVGASPLFATALAVTVGGEAITAPILFGTISIIGGLAVILSRQ